MSGLVAALDVQQRGENGHKELSWSKDTKELILQLSFQLTRTNDLDRLKIISDKFSYLLVKLFYEPNNELELKSALLTLPLLTRDIISGKGEYNLFYHLLGSMSQTIDRQRYSSSIILTQEMEHILCQFIKTCIKLQGFDHAYGSWKDMKYFLNHLKQIYGEDVLVEKRIFRFIIELMAEQLLMDTFSCWLSSKSDNNHSNNPSNTPSLLAKWAPREKSKKFGWQAKYLAKEYFKEWCHPRENSKLAQRKCCTYYRKVIANLNRNLKTPQINQCNGTWKEINFNNNVTSITLSRQKRAFMNITKDNHSRGVKYDRDECRKNYENYIRDCRLGNKKIKASRVGIIEIIKEALSLKPDDNKTLENNINLQWKASGMNLKNLKNLIAIVDTSESMSGDGGTPLYAAIGLGLRIAENSRLGKRIMTFSESPQWINLENLSSLTDMAKTLKKDNTWGVSTNFEAMMRLICNACIEKDLDNETVKDLVLVVFSDMQINQADSKSPYLHLLVKNMFANAGRQTSHKIPYDVPHMIYWNLRSTGGFPSLSTEQNVSMISGFSPILLNSFCEKGKSALHDYTPWKLLLHQLQNERYSWIWKMVQ